MLILVDVYNLVFRSHFAFKSLSDKHNHPTGVYYGVLRALLTLRKLDRRIVFCWDHTVPESVTGVSPNGLIGAPNWRHSVIKVYKANRRYDSNDRALVLKQLPCLATTLANMGYPNLGIPGTEADDLIGILCGTLKDKILIYTTDQDVYQLLEQDRVEVLRPTMKGGTTTITEHKVRKEYGISVRRWAEYLALGGDHSDNIKAVKGWGPKKAIKLIQAGVDLRSGNGLRYAEVEPHWEALLKTYEVTRLPRTLQDPRIKHLTEGYDFSDLARYQEPIRRTGALDRFTRFCAQHDLAEFMAQRHAFFSRA